jgi:hypothetical protein
MRKWMRSSRDVISCELFWTPRFSFTLIAAR